MNDEKQEVLYAFFSAKQAKDFGYCIYLDENGNKVSCTQVNKENVYTGYWDDVVYVGKVVKWVSTVNGTTKFIDYPEIKLQTRRGDWR